MNLQTLKQRYGIVGNSPKLNNALNTAIQVAPTDLSVLITGESGVGKEVFSKIIHQMSKRKHNPFIAVNCGAIPEGTIDSELFGHEKGAFTGAHESRKGYFEAVNGGTIFLDEVTEMPLSTQARLLRVLETGEFIRVGSSKVQKTDVRIIGASNKDILKLVDEGKFREDLYYRLNTVPLYIPPLRERDEDIYLIFRKFCVDFAEKHNTTPVKLDEKARQILLKYRWPGNIRQLKNLAEQISVLAEDKLVTGEELLQYLPPSAGQSNLPVIATPGRETNGKAEYSERELLYKVLFDLKKDVNDLKRVVIGLLKNNDQTIKDDNASLIRGWDRQVETFSQEEQEQDLSSGRPIIISEGHADRYRDAEVIDDSLSIAEKEKELIIKALKKHHGRRKEASMDLGISERTLYRKIKEYDINL